MFLSTDNKFDALTNCQNLVTGIVHGGKAGNGQTYWFEGTPKNIAAFLVKNADADQIQITTVLDTPVLSSFGCFIDQCPDKTLLASVMEQLVPMQMGAAAPEEFFCPTQEEYENYCRQMQSDDMTMA